jgi:hypothetical protein
LDLAKVAAKSSYSIKVSQFDEHGWVLDDPKWIKLFRRVMSDCASLSSLVQGRIFRGIITGLNEAFEIDDKEKSTILSKSPKAVPLIHRFFGGQDIRRYVTRDQRQHLIAIPSGWTRASMKSKSIQEDAAWRWLSEEYRAVAEHLAPFKRAALERQDKGEFWWELRSCDYYSVLNGSKIIYPDIAKGPRFVLDTEGNYIRNTAYCLDTTNKCLLGVLNSRMFWFLLGRISIPFGTRDGEFRYRLFTQYMERIPLPPCFKSSSERSGARAKILDCVEKILEVQARVTKVKTDHERTVIERQIEATDREIDRLVYELYGLSEEEIRLVEGATA